MALVIDDLALADFLVLFSSFLFPSSFIGILFCHPSLIGVAEESIIRMVGEEEG